MDPDSVATTTVDPAIEVTPAVTTDPVVAENANTTDSPITNPNDMSTDPVNAVTTPEKPTTTEEITQIPVDPIAKTFTFKEKTYTSYLKTNMANGYIEEFYNGEERCWSGLVLIPGI